MLKNNEANMAGVKRAKRESRRGQNDHGSKSYMALQTMVII